MENLNENQIEDENLEFLGGAKGELYTVDINSSKNTIIYGGKNEFSEIYDYKEEFMLTRIEDFSDSVIFNKFISKDRLVIVTANGTVAVVDQNKETTIFEVDDDISTAIFTDHLVLGAVSGQVYLYNNDFEHVNTFGGHYSEILAVDFQEGRVLSLSESGLVAHDVQGRCLYSLKCTQATSFKYIASDVICFAGDQKIRIFKESKKLFELKTEETVECIELVQKNLVIGGYAEYIQLIDTTGHFATFKLQVDSCATIIKKYKDFQIIFSNLDGYIGLVDIRNLKTLKYFAIEVGVIFDIAIDGDMVGVAGSDGFHVLDLVNDEPIDLTDIE